MIKPFCSALALSFAMCATTSPVFAQTSQSSTVTMVDWTYRGITYYHVTRVNRWGFYHEDGTTYESFADISFVPGPAPMPSLEAFIQIVEARGIPVNKYY